MFSWSHSIRDSSAVSAAPPYSSLTASTHAAEESFASSLSTLVLQNLSEALRKIPMQEKTEYLEALRLAPHLTETESDPIKFLRYADWDASIAAQRLVAYWRYRKLVFGADRAFLPLNLSGNGALDAQAIELFRSGAFVLPGKDSQSHTVWFVDRNREAPMFGSAIESRIRLFFFIMHHIAENPISQSDGCVVIVRPARHIRDKTLTRASSDLLRTALPVRIKAIHMVYYGESRQSLLQNILPSLMDYVGRFFSSMMIFHNCYSSDQILQKLAPHGITPSSLPDYFGGLWSHEHDFTRFLVDNGFPIDPMTSNLLSGSGGVATSAPAGRLNLSSNLDANLSLHQKMALNDFVFSAGSTTAQAQFGIGSSNGSEALNAPAASSRGGEAFPIANQIPSQVSNAVAPGTASLTTINGTRLQDASLIETPSIHETAFSSLNEALSILPNKDKAAYFEAVRLVPHLVQKESNPLAYLRCEKYNTWAAAKRLALYWKHRVEFFQDRAFLPMTQTGSGALNDEDIRNLRSGYVCLLPRDAGGRSVIGYDPSKRSDQISSHLSRMRVGFYFCSVVCQNEVTPTDGMVLIVILSRQFLYKLDPSTRIGADVVVDSFVFQSPTVHIVYSPSQTTSKLSFMDRVLPVLLRMLGKLMNGVAQFHVGDSYDELHQKLETCGLARSGLPEAIGGGFTDGDFVNWMKNRQLFELQMYRQSSITVADPPEDSVSGSIVLSAPTTRAVLPMTQKDFDNAMQLLPENTKEAYLEAMKRVPDLVKKESDPVRFLKSENYDCVAAARRLARYWRIRSEIFGDRAFLPMDQTVDGALARQDVAVLQTGFLTQLPNDTMGRSVIFCDGGRLQKSSRSSQLRCFFYIWSVISENELSQTDGYSVVYTITEPSFDRACKESLDLAIQALPAKLKCFHLLGCRSEDTSEEEYHQGPVRATLELLNQDRSMIHVCESQGDFAQKLVAHGMSKNGLPKALGGNWGFQEFVQWQELRIRHEWDLPIGRATRDAAEGYFNIVMAKHSGSFGDEEKIERKRRMNVIHSRRKRERERIEVEGLNEQCIGLREERKRLVREGKRLEQLLASSRAVIAEAT